MGNYRKRLEIIADILQIASQNAKKTQIMYQANLSYKVLKKYLHEMTAASLISFETSGQLYVITQKGQDFLAAYRDYSKTSKIAEKRLNDVNSKKKDLEALCANNR